MEPIIRPSLNDLKNRISEIEIMDISLCSIDEIKSQFKLLFTGYALSTPLLQIGMIVYRGVKYAIKPNQFSFLIYPPADKARMGRANREGNSIFYCATEKHVPLYELDVKPGDRLIISEWEVKNEILVNNVGYTESVFHELDAERQVPNFNLGRKIHEEQLKEENNLVRNYLAKTFSQSVANDEPHLYKLTNAIAERHFSEGKSYGSASIKGLQYPTIRMKANADNIALSKLVIDNGFLNCEKVEYIEVLEILGDLFTYKILDVAFKIEHGQIQWKNLKSNWVWNSTSELYFIDEGDEIFAYNSEGDQIEPI